MRLIRFIQNIAVLSVLFLTFSCGKEMSLEEHASGMVRFCFDTRNDGSGPDASTTYRILGYNPSTFALEKTGTYYLKNQNDSELTPYTLDNDGNMIDGESNDGMQFSGTNQKLLIVAVSPANDYNDDGSLSIFPENNGNTEIGTSKLHASELPELKQLGPYGTINLTQKLKECKALIGFKFYKKKTESVQDFEIEDLRLVNAGDGHNIKFFPARRQIELDQTQQTSAININLSSSETTESDAEGNTLCYLTADDNMARIVPAIYAPPNEVAEVLKITSSLNLVPNSNYLVMRCKLKQSSRETNIELPLTISDHEILPQRKYIYKIVVCSNIINLSVDVFGENTNDWEEVNPGETSIGGDNDDIKTIPIGTWEIVKTDNGNGWELNELGEQTIE